MKINPIPSSATPAVNVDEGRSAGSERLARAKAIATGQTPDTATQEQRSTEAKTDIKKILMKTQRSPDRHDLLVNEAPETTQDTPVATQSDTLDNAEQTQKAPEATDPTSPQYAALAKVKRALQTKEKELAAREAALKGESVEPKASGYTKEQIKTNVLGILRESGVTNEELTEAILRETQDLGPGYSKVEAEIQALNKRLEDQTKALDEREKAAEQQVLSQVRKDVDQLISQGDEFEAVREAGYADKVVDLVYRVFKEEGEILDLSEAAQLIENELIEESLKFAKLKKVQNRIQTENPPQQQQPAKSSGPNTRMMRTLTNRDGASAPMSPRERAIAAFYGKLK